MVDDLVSGVASQLGSFAQAGFDAADNVASVAEGLNNPGTALSGLDSFCSSVPQPSGGTLTLTKPPAIDGTPPTPDCGNTAWPNPDDTTMGPGSQTDRDMDADGSEDGSSTTADVDESGACPELANAAPPDLFVICVPVALAGDFNAGKKSIILLPGGAILALPVGSSLGAPSTPSSGTSGGTLIIDGGATGDYPVPDGTPLPSGWSSPSRDLVITGGARVLGSDLTFAKGIISDYGVRTASPGTTKLTVTAGDVDVEKTGRIDMSGLGYEGGNRAVPQDGYGATAPGQTGSQYNNGGSHAGLGGLDGDVGTVAGSTYDNPYDPALPGGGGGGQHCRGDLRAVVLRGAQ